MTIVIILINFPWYAVCCDLFASSMQSLAALFHIELPAGSHLFLALCCVIIGTAAALRGIRTITHTTRILVPALLLVGMIVVIVAFRSVPVSAIWNYMPKESPYSNSIIPYILSIEANFAFVITLVGGMAEIPRLCKSERSGYYAGVLGQGLAGSFFVVVGAVMAIATEYVSGKMIDDPTVMMATLAVPVLGLTSLLLVAFANIGTQAVGSYIYGVMLKSTFKKADYRLLVLILGLYVGILCVWGKIIEYFGAFLTISACVYAPLAALLFVDFFFIRRQKLDLYAAYELKGLNTYHYTAGFNIIGFVCLVAGVLMSLLIYNPVNREIHTMFFFRFTPTGCALLGTGLLYYLLCKLPPARLKIVKSDRRGMKPPYLVLGTHQSFTDFHVTPLALFPHRANYISELEGFENYGEWIYRQAGCLGTRKFVDDLALIKNIKRVLDRGNSLVLYPEARYANVGTSSVLPRSLAKLVKFLQVPVVTLNMKGNYLQSPIWNLSKRKEARLHTDMTYALTREEVQRMTLDEIYDRLSELLSYDEYRWQRETKMRISYKKRAEGLHLPLYQCLGCGEEHTMCSKGAKLFCSSCNRSWTMDEYGTLKEDASAKEVYIPDWYEQEREFVQGEIEEGNYLLDMPVRIETLPNAKNFIDCGRGHIRHDKEGFRLTFTDYMDNKEKILTVKSSHLFSIHTEYDYRGKGQCVTLSTPDNTYFIYPLEEGFNATKIQFAVEYLYSLPSQQ